jgi:DNA polymerase elongation subunit (family B)
VRSAGFVKIPTSGRYGARTVAVIKIIQKSRHVKQTGEVNTAFWKVLQAGKITATKVVIKKPINKPVSEAHRREPRARRPLHLPRSSSVIDTHTPERGPIVGIAPV